MFSIVAPLDDNRLIQFKETKRVYDSFPQEKEFLIPTRNPGIVKYYLRENKLLRGTHILPYEHSVGFNPSMALNIGVRNAQYDNIIITSPEVKPITDVLSQFEASLGTNIICDVADEAIDGTLTPLVSVGYRDENPAMYFLALFNKSDIEKINGWDEDFMQGYAYEDNDFGSRWVRAGIPWVLREDIRAVHQYHPRSETIPGGATTNYNKFQENNAAGIIRCANGLHKL